MGIKEFIKGKYHKQYYEKYSDLPNMYDTVGRMEFEKQEKILKKALQENKTWREVVNEEIKKGILL